MATKKTITKSILGKIKMMILPTAQPREGTAGVGMISRWLLTGEAGVKHT